MYSFRTANQDLETTGITTDGQTTKISCLGENSSLYSMAHQSFWMKSLPKFPLPQALPPNLPKFLRLELATLLDLIICKHSNLVYVCVYVCGWSCSP